MIRDLGMAVGALAIVTVIAELLGAANLGTALTFGAMAFMATIVGLILVRGPRSEPPRDGSSSPASPSKDVPRTRPKPSGRPRA